ncbi:hypothetical protein NFHSH190041_07350 [Shewanella sp. NFH-SH190041]|uniref:DUF4856 domain-containing protein n=1 Tax=Shewanella sp. NFH-SH190041 TaxID=2950245 RepID=UPI0021C43FEF|nr:DUF4856 domain-containing protein [Shewanella sp. NFH-SH190041]BDM63283.1 hypothetical protein NFHSH190041_07350 [Shewanella sp. NFH-SH190041]
MQAKKTLSATLVAMSLGTLTACGGSSDDSPAPQVNAAPTNITLSQNSVTERLAGQMVGQLAAVDPDSGDSHTFTTQSTVFTIDGNMLKMADGAMLFTSEEGDDIDVLVTVADQGGLTKDVMLTVALTPKPEMYEFASHYGAHRSSVSYTGQTARHILIAELNQYVKSGLKADMDAGTVTTAAQTLAKLNQFFNPDEATQYPDLPITFLDNSKDALIADITGYKSLLQKVAGNDSGGQSKDWNTAGVFVGWTDGMTPTAVVGDLFQRLADNVEIEKTDGNTRQDPLGNDISKIYLDEDGVDLAQMIQKFLLMAVPYSQASNDYFGDDTDDKGLRTDNTGPAKEGALYTNLEHQYDEGFGYFGAARNYLDYADVEIAGKVSEGNGRADWNKKHDTDGDGKIDLRSEYNFGQAVNAAKRDLGSAANAAATDYTKQAMDAFVAGRQLINDHVGADLTPAQKTELKDFVTTALDAWERAIAATVVHYINDTRADLAPLATNGDPAQFNYADLAKHFSEMKGFALGLQFSEYAAINDADFAQLQRLMGMAPVITGDVDSYRADLLQARDLLQRVYNFNADNTANW